jgi:hypothetical protein
MTTRPRSSDQSHVGQAAGPRPYDDFTFLTREECSRRRDGNATNVNKYAGVLYNHFQWCAWKKITFVVRAPGSIYVPQQSFDARLTMPSFASETMRTVNTVFFIDHITNLYPSTLTPSRVHLTIQVSCTVTCNVSPNPVSRTVAEMEVAPTEVLMQSPEEPTSGNTNAVSKGGFVVTVTAKIDGALTVPNSTGFEEDVRCDSTNLIRGDFRTPACIFSRVQGTFSLNSKDQGVVESAKHIREAQDSPNAQPPTPPAGGTKIMPSVLQRHWNDALKEAQRVESRKACQAAVPEKSANTDCDEFPFASTLQGSLAPPLPNYNYSVRYIPFRDNRRSGCWLNKWYVKDRILEGDKFTVSIFDGLEVAEDGEVICDDES